MRVLMIVNEVPFPPVGGGRLRSYQVAEALAARHDVTLVGFAFDQKTIAPNFPVDVISVPWHPPRLYQEMYSTDSTISRRAYEKLAYEIDQPWAVSYFQSSVMTETLKQVTKTEFDVLLIRDSTMGQYLSLLPPKAPLLLDFTDVLTRIAQRNADNAYPDEKDRSIREANRMLRFEKSVAERCALGLVCSELEADAARKLLDLKRHAVIPNDVDTSFFTPAEEPTTSGCLLFTGTLNSQPNTEAGRYFAADILPLVLRKITNAKLYIVGRSPSEAVMRLVSDHIAVHPDVPDVRPYYRDAEIVVVPLLQGGGTRRKILEAAACGKAIVTTSLGVEGLDFTHGRELVVADSATAFAEAVIDLSGNEQKRREIGREARRGALRYDCRRIGSLLCDLVESASTMGG